MATVTIERLVAGGDGVGRLADGMVVFVPRTAPGDQVEIDVVERRRRFARGRLRRVVTEGPGRVTPECHHYGRDRCGGCQLQHVSIKTQHDAKRSFVRDALRRIGGRPDVEPALEPSPKAWHYRSKVRLAVQQGRAGFHAYDDMSVFALERCAIATEPLMTLWGLLRDSPPPPGADALILRTDRDGGLHVVVEGTAAPWVGPVGVERLAGVAVSWWWRPRGGVARAVAGRQTGFPVLAFEQVNPVLASRVRQAAVQALGDVAERVIWDLYGGVGDTARMLAERGARVWSVDVDRAAVAWAERQTVAPGSITYVAALVEEALHRLPEAAAVVVNPPRTGLHRRVTDQLERWGARRRGTARLCYVSCDPATLARDLARMPSFALREVQAYDLFPQTAHVEIVAMLDAT